MCQGTNPHLLASGSACHRQTVPAERARMEPPPSIARRSSSLVCIVSIEPKKKFMALIKRADVLAACRADLPRGTLPPARALVGLEVLQQLPRHEAVRHGREAVRGLAG